MNALRFFLALFGILCCFTVGFSFREISDGRPITSTPWMSLLSFGDQANLSPNEIFKRNYSNIQSRFYKSVGKDDLKFAAMQGMFSSLGDPHTNFLEPKTAQEFNRETEGNFVGIGARLDDDPLGAKIMTVFAGSPAKAAGLQEGDVIVTVGTKDVAGIATEEIVTFIRGEEGTVVELGIIRNGEKKTLRVRRAQVAIPTAESKVLADGKVGYIPVTQFAEVTPAQFHDALESVNSAGVAGLIIDMRSNPGGLLESAVDMLGNFVDHRLVVTMKGKGDPKSEYTPRGKVMQLPKPIVILINEDSASAAEIFSGVMSDYKQAVLIGQHSYGKASVQNVIQLRDGASAKITTHRYYLPSGKDISRRMDEEGSYLSGGLKPDESSELKIDEKTKFGEPGRDSQLDAGIRYILDKAGIRQAS